jgi:two-component system response regulator
MAFAHSLVLVEDNQDDEVLSLKAISASGVSCNVEVIRDGGDALQILLSPEGPTPSLIVLDFHLPCRNGLEILRELRKHEKTRQLPIVMLSELESDKEVMSCLEEGANSCVRKPLDAQAYIDQVALTVRYWLTVHKNPTKEDPSLI